MLFGKEFHILGPKYEVGKSERIWLNIDESDFQFR